MKRLPTLGILRLTALILLSLVRVSLGQTQDIAVPAVVNTPASLAEQAKEVLYEHQDYDRTMELLRKAISLNPNDAGAKYDPLTIYRQSKDMPEHGLAQVKQMLKDRQLMGSYLDQSDDLWKWTVWKFNLSVADNKIVWDPTPPAQPFRAEHWAPIMNQNGRIRVREVSLAQVANEKDIAFDQLWSAAIFELHNMDNASDAIALFKQAERDAISEEEYVRSIFDREYRAAQRTRKWYVEVFLPHAKKYKIDTSIELWHCDQWESATSKFGKYTDKKSYPWTPYSEHYQELKSGHFKSSQKSGGSDAKEEVKSIGK